MYASMVQAIAQCLCVCHKLVLYQMFGWIKLVSGIKASLTYPTLYHKTTTLS